MLEIWRDISGYEGLYKISNFGRIKSFKNNEKYIKPSKTKRGYLNVKFCKNKCINQFYLHRLVASAFIENIENKPIVNHKNGNKEDNNVFNLEWCTSSENAKHAHANNLNKGKKKSIAQYNKNGDLLKIWDSQTKASDTLGISIPSINRCCKKNTGSAGGYIWKNVEKK